MTATLKMIRSLQKDGPATAKELAGRVGIIQQSAHRIARTMVKAGVMRIKSYRMLPRRSGAARVAVYEYTGKSFATRRVQQGYVTPFLDELPKETKEQAINFKLRLLRAHPHGYTSFKPTPDSLRCDLRRDAVGAASSLV
jgi:DNA-binding Lrp family transcriptional regulator